MKGILQTKWGTVFYYCLYTSFSSVLLAQVLIFSIGSFREILNDLLGYGAFISLLLIILNHEICISCAFLETVHGGVYLKIYLQPSCSEGNENLISICYAGIKLYLITISFLTWVLSWSAKPGLCNCVQLSDNCCPLFAWGVAKTLKSNSIFLWKAFNCLKLFR